jgi:hypothetical protein
MHKSYIDRLNTFTEANLPDLDEVVLGALAYLASQTLPKLDVRVHERPLVVGSGNALQTGRILFHDTAAYFSDEAGATHALTYSHPGALYIISASGSKHAIELARRGIESKLPTYLVTAQEHAPAIALVGRDHAFVYPHIREPYTYNTSTYLSMLFGQGNESIVDTLSWIQEKIEPMLSLDLASYQAFLMTIPNEHEAVRAMFETKFDELFGPYILGRACTLEGMKHAKTVVTAPHQCIISFGCTSAYGNPGARMTILLPEHCGPAGLIAIGYFVIGKIQKTHPSYFKDRIVAYAKETSEMFGQTISPIVS